MSEELLKIENLHANVDGTEILKGVNLEINKGEIHVIMGPNGSGKSTLANVIMDNPVYTVTQGRVYFEGEDITELTTDKRAKKGMFMSFQTPEEVEGISLENFLRTAKAEITGEEQSILDFRDEMEETMEILKLSDDYLSRYLNVGFSGGEKKKSEILQLLVLNPKFAILDETDSGLDVDAVKLVSQGIREYKNEDNALLIITHHSEIMKDIHPDYVHVIVDGQIVQEGGEELMNQIIEHGFEKSMEEGKVHGK
ncbi:MAG: Fe-S cluster assembly ATPase SufC [Tissierellia bacterium]|nr:Fe-S cluster assembly ATPase SufC [Tissierellia bacterium]